MARTTAFTEVIDEAAGVLDELQWAF